MNFPKRRLQRLGGYDYSQCGVYFVTLCTQKKLCLLGHYGDEFVIKNEAGKMVDRIFLEVSRYYPEVTVENHVTMPNHLHALLSIQGDGTTQRSNDMDGTTLRSFPTSISEYIQRFKTLTTRLYIEGVKTGVFPPFDGKIWQKSFHDHIIRDEMDFTTHLDYIDNNPIRFMDDEYR